MKAVIKGILKTFCYVALFLGMQLLVSFGVQFVYGFQAGVEAAASGIPIDSVELTQEMQMFLMENQNVLLMISGALTFLFLWVFFKCRKKSLSKEVQLEKLDKRMVLPCIIMGWSFSLLVSSVLNVIPLPEELVMSYAESSQGIAAGNYFVRILATVVLIPMVEEVIFRGLIYTRLRKAINVPVAILVSSLVFGMMHGHILWTSYTFIGGILFAVVMEKTKSLKASILLHMALNSVSAVIGGIEISGLLAYVVILVALILIIGSLCFVVKNSDAEEVVDLKYEAI